MLEHEGEGPVQLQSREARRDAGKSVAPGGRPMPLKHRPSKPTCTAPSNVSLRSGMVALLIHCAPITRITRSPGSRYMASVLVSGSSLPWIVARTPTAVLKAGSCGALFKVRLSSHGYTVVAKGVEYKHVHKLEHEKRTGHILMDTGGLDCVGSGKENVEPSPPRSISGALPNNISEDGPSKETHARVGDSFAPHLEPDTSGPHILLHREAMEGHLEFLLWAPIWQSEDDIAKVHPDQLK
ncbi:hypothetical protein RJZ56_003331 [Blastomyces dermatitidis]|uniref:Uncharacterized protein n=2 Tax=Ajellomyces dermatitidis TaxID=5039 RepID=F2T8K4_AJEDA|nr:uncharacterized protein BDCG_16700 [Blastomyces dermatitidis ER-3]EGE79567.1 hypothetical protein BDDG_02508 [Blastomyces dermatitidis ATCC 18188]OAT00607.1 hypothetical protein BDCG_16700 [Blastomyces dermatitidis ER-3]